MDYYKKKYIKYKLKYLNLIQIGGYSHMYKDNLGFDKNLNNNICQVESSFTKNDLDRLYCVITAGTLLNDTIFLYVNTSPPY